MYGRRFSALTWQTYASAFLCHFLATSFPQQTRRSPCECSPMSLTGCLPYPLSPQLKVKWNYIWKIKSYWYSVKNLHLHQIYLTQKNESLFHFLTLSQVLHYMWGEKKHKSKLTKLVHLFRRHLADVPLDEKVEVGDDYEGWSKARPRMIPHNHVVALELPVCVTSFLHFDEGVTRWRNKKENHKAKSVCYGST